MVLFFASLTGIILILMQVAWLYNVRGSDVSYCPVVHSFAIVTSDSAFFYVDKRKLSTEVSFQKKKTFTMHGSCFSTEVNNCSIERICSSTVLISIYLHGSNNFYLFIWHYGSEVLKHTNIPWMPFC